MIRLGLIALVLLLWGCGTENQEGTKIPGLPALQDKAAVNQVAIESLTDALARNPRSSEIYFKRSRLLFEAKKVTESLQDINQALEYSSNNGSYFLQKALILQELGKPLEALDNARRAEILNVNVPQLLVLLGDLYQQVNQFSKASQYLNQSLDVTPTNGEAYFYKGLIAAKQADTTLAIDHFNQALRLRPAFMPTYVQLSSVYTKLREYPTATYYAKKGLEYYPKSASLQYNLGLIYHRTWKIDSALTCYKKAMQLQPSLTSASFNAGVLYFKLNDLKTALQCFEQTLRYNTRVPLLNFYLGQCLEYLGRFDRALEFYEIAVKLDPADTKSTNGMWRLRKRLYAEQYGLAQNSTPQNIPELPPLPQKTFDTTRIKVQEIHTPSAKPKLVTKSDSMLKRHMNTLQKIN